MFTKSAKFYDAIYSFKDYQDEVRQIRDLIRARKPDSRSLLDVACGTGHHLQYLHDDFEVHGIDLDTGLLEIAKERLPDVPLHEGDMRDFELGKTFDAVTCLFSSIGYVTSEDELRAAIARMAAHLNPGGVLVVEGWIGPDEWKHDHIGSLYVDQDDLKIARMNVPETKGRFSVVDFHYLVATHEGVDYFTEPHSLYLFTREEYLGAFESAGLSVEVDGSALMGRGVYIGVKSSNL